MRADTNFWLKSVCNQKNINLTLNSIMKLQKNRKGNIVSAKNLLNFIKGNSYLNPLADTYNEMKNVSNIVSIAVSDVKKTLENVRMSSIDRFLF